MSYIMPSEFVTKMVDAGESKIYMATRDVLIRAFMAGGAILALAAVFAITVGVQTGSPLVGALLFPVGFCMLYLMGGFDLLTGGVFMLTPPLALLDRRPPGGVDTRGILRNWGGWVFLGNFGGALTVATIMAFVFTYGFNTEAGVVGGDKIARSASPYPGLCRTWCGRLVHHLPAGGRAYATGWCPWVWWAR